MRLSLFTQAILINVVMSEGYYCPYTELGSSGENDLIYDYYDFDGTNWVRKGETGWMNREDYCNAKADTELHFDAGEAKCIDSVNKCIWSDNNCIANPDAAPDCVKLCQAVLDGKGLECLGEGCGSREDFYKICDGEGYNPIPENPENPGEEPENPGEEPENPENPGEEPENPENPGECEWPGHCEGASCESDNDCSGNLTCNSGICGNGDENPGEEPSPTPTQTGCPCCSTTISITTTDFGLPTGCV